MTQQQQNQALNPQLLQQALSFAGAAASSSNPGAVAPGGGNMQGNIESMLAKFILKKAGFANPVMDLGAIMDNPHVYDESVSNMILDKYLDYAKRPYPGYEKKCGPPDMCPSESGLHEFMTAIGFWIGDTGTSFTVSGKEKESTAGTSTAARSSKAA